MVRVAAIERAHRVEHAIGLVDVLGESGNGGHARVVLGYAYGNLGRRRHARPVAAAAAASARLVGRDATTTTATSTTQRHGGH